MILKWFPIALAAAQLNPDDFADSAQSLCQKFYKDEKNFKDGDTISTSYVSNDEEAIMFSCVTTGKPGIFEGFNPTPKSFPDEVALKIYAGDLGKEKNFTILAAIDEQFIRHPSNNDPKKVYSWEETEDVPPLHAKFAYPWWKDYEEFEKVPGAFNDTELRTAAIHKLATLHRYSDVKGIDEMKHRNPGNPATPANTYLVSSHFDTLWADLAEKDELKELFANIGWTEEQLREEILFTERTLQDYYDANPETAVFCHNNLDSGSIIQNKNKTYGTNVVLVGYEQAGYGFRMWDIIYLIYSGFAGNGVEVTDEIINEALVAYFDLVSDFSIETLQAEFRHHLPYYALERLVFSQVAGWYDLIEGLAGSIKQTYGSAIAEFDRQLPYVADQDNSSTSTLILSSILLLLNLL